MIVGISGGSGSGKTSFIKALKNQFGEHEMCVLSQDDYYFPREEQKIDKEGVSNFDLPTSIDQEAFVKDIQLLKKGEIVTREEYVFNNKLATPKQLSFKPAPIIIVEGLFIFSNEELMKYLDLKVFVKARDNVKIIRRIKRDRIERNYPLDDVLYRYEHHVMPSFEKHIKPYIKEVDIIINNDKSFDLGMNVLSAYFREFLSNDA